MVVVVEVVVLVVVGIVFVVHPTDYIVIYKVVKIIIKPISV